MGLESVLPQKQQLRPVMEESFDGWSVASQQSGAHTEDGVDQGLPGKLLGFRWSYTHEIIGELPACCLVGEEMWRTRSLICFDAVEWPLPDRVMHQFGLKQMIPASCNNDRKLHKIDGRRGVVVTLKIFMHILFHFGLNAINLSITGNHLLVLGSLTCNDPYLQLFRKNSFLLIGNLNYKPDVGFVGAGELVELLTRVMKTLYSEANVAIEKFDAASGLQVLKRIQDKLSATSEAIEQYYRPSELELPAQKSLPMPPPTVVPKSSCKRSHAAAASDFPAQEPLLTPGLVVVSKPSLVKVLWDAIPKVKRQEKWKAARMTTILIQLNSVAALTPLI